MRGRSEALRVGAELLPVLLVLGCLGGTLTLVIAAHRRHAPPAKAREENGVAVAPSPPPKSEPVALPPPPSPTPAPPAPEDPTPKLLDRYASLAAEQRAEAAKADQKAASLEAARKAAEAEAERWRRREMLVKARADELTSLAGRLEAEADALARERDVLAKRRDEEREDLQKAQSRSQDSYAILPYKGANGTWQRPIAIECRDGVASIRPGGPTFNMTELAGGFGMRSSPIVAAVARELARIRAEVGPDGAPSVPYILFVVRPSGIRPYYEARGRLERLGIAFGYELVDADVEIDFPDLAEPSEWPGAPPGPAWPEAAPGGLASRADNPYVWPAQTTPPAADDAGLPTAGPRGGRPDGKAEDARGTGSPLDLSALAEGPPIDYRPDPRQPRSGHFPGTSPDSSGSGREERDDAEGYRWPGSPAATPPPIGRKRGGPGDRPGAPRSVGDRLAAQGAARPGNGGIPAAIPPIGAGSGSRAAAVSHDAPPPTASRGGAIGRGDGSVAGGLSPRGESAGPNATNLPQLQPVPDGGHGLVDLGNSPPGAASDTLPGAIGSPEGKTTDSLADASDGPTGEAGEPREQVGIPGAPSVEASEVGRSNALAGAEGPKGQGTNRPLAVDVVGGSPAAGARAGAGSAKPGTGTGTRPSESPKTAQGSGGPGGVPGLTGTGSSAVQGLGFGLPSSGSSAGAPTMSAPFGLAGGGGTTANTGARIDVVVDCGRDGVTVQPGGYRLSRQALESGDLLVRRLEAVVASERARRPGESAKPLLHFLVQPGAEGTFWQARQQTTFAGLDWPATLRVAEGTGAGSFAGRLR